MDLDFAEATAAVDTFYHEGGRCLYLEGGEPFLWREGTHRLDDMVDYAHGLGYLTVVVYTNGTLPLRTSADTVFVSVDGLQATHDALRGTSFERIMGDVASRGIRRSSSTPRSTRATRTRSARSVSTSTASGNIRGIFFYLHTPYYGHDAL